MLHHQLHHTVLALGGEGNYYTINDDYENNGEGNYQNNNTINDDYENNKIIELKLKGKGKGELPVQKPHQIIQMKINI